MQCNKCMDEVKSLNKYGLCENCAKKIEEENSMYLHYNDYLKEKMTKKNQEKYFKKKNKALHKPIRRAKFKKIASGIFMALFLSSVILITIFYIPKYGEYRSGNMKMRGATGYYNIFQTTATFSTIYNQKTSSDLQIDFSQWLILVVIESAVFLLPALLLKKDSKSEV